MPIYMLYIYLNIKNWFISVFINIYLCRLAHRLLVNGYSQIFHIHAYAKIILLEIAKFK